MGKKVKCTEKDILMGRGKRVSEWPGNIYFRQMVNQYRESYNNTERSRKVFVAQDVIKEIEKIGGRFLKEEGDNDWVEVEMDRAIEKTCQALREKEKSNPPISSPFDGTIRFPDGPPPQKKPRRKHRRHDDSSDDDESMTGSTTETDSGRAMETDDSDDDDSKSKKAKPISVPAWNHTVLLQQLTSFQQKFGHCAVPPTWKEQPKLAEWAIVQRQLHREVKNGYRESTADEKQRLEQLEELGFCWDYDEWHWNRQYQQLQAWYDSVAALEEEQVTSSPAAVAPPAKEIVEWIQEQRRQYKEANWQVPSHRVEKLRKVGVTF